MTATAARVHRCSAHCCCCSRATARARRPTMQPLGAGVGEGMPARIGKAPEVSQHSTSPCRRRHRRRQPPCAPLPCLAPRQAAVVRPSAPSRARGAAPAPQAFLGGLFGGGKKDDGAAGAVQVRAAVLLRRCCSPPPPTPSARAAPHLLQACHPAPKRAPGRPHRAHTHLISTASALTAAGCTTVISARCPAASSAQW